MGPGLLPAAASQGKESCHGFKMPRPALAENSLENVADQHNLQHRFPHGESTETRVVGPFGKIHRNPVNKFYEKTLLSTENFWVTMPAVRPPSPRPTGRGVRGGGHSSCSYET